MKHYIIALLLAGMVSVSVHCQPPNNAIFNGGTGDGWATATNGVVSNSIFLGSVGDGWGTATNGVVSNSIFLGSTGNGWGNATNGAASNSIFLGSTGDGWGNATNNALANAIYNGGVGDGWSSDFRALGALPITLLYFTAYKYTPAVAKLEWSVTNAVNFKEFVLERSTNGTTYTPFATIAYNTSNTFMYIDVSPIIGLNYYRLKMLHTNAPHNYSLVRTVQFNDDKHVLVVYPNPAKDFIKIYSSLPITQVTILNNLGQRIKKYLPNYTATYPITGVVAGMYTIQITTLAGITNQKLLIQ